MPSGLKNPDLTGHTLGALTLKERFHKSGRPYWWCECECGNRASRGEQYLLSDKAKNLSCGCKHPFKVNTGKASHSWLGCGDMPGHYMAALRCGAGKRGLEFDLTIEYLWELFEVQGGECALSGLPIAFAEGASRRYTRPQTASLDRKDPDLGYVAGNVWWVHKAVNAMRNHFEEDVFVMVCNAVAEHRPMVVDPGRIDAVKATKNSGTKRKAA